MGCLLPLCLSRVFPQVLLPDFAHTGSVLGPLKVLTVVSQILAVTVSFDLPPGTVCLVIVGVGQRCSSDEPAFVRDIPVAVVALKGLSIFHGQPVSANFLSFSILFNLYGQSEPTFCM